MGRASALGALAIEIRPSGQGAGLSSRMVRTMAALGAAHGLANLIAPVRPSWKERYPLTPIERYAGWRRPDGLPFDPGARSRQARRRGASSRAAVAGITGAVAEWERWPGLPFPESGQYAFPRGLAPVWIDREADRGTYYEPNVWMRHRLGAGTATSGCRRADGGTGC